MTLTWTPVSGYGCCYVAISDGFIFETYKAKSGYYYFLVKEIRRANAPRTIYDSSTDAFQERTHNPQRVKDIACRWLTIREGKH